MSEARMTVSLFGATGRTGRHIAQALVDKGYRVQALVRDAAAAKTLLPASLVIFQGDLNQEADVAATLNGADAAIFVASGFKAEDKRRIDFESVRMAVDAASSFKVRYLVLLSSAGTTQAEHPHNMTFGDVLKWKFAGEQYLRQSGLNYSVVRGLGLRDRPGGQASVQMLQGDKIAFGEDIAREDVARFLADLVPIGLGQAGEALSASIRQFDTAFDPRSILNATFEIYNISEDAAPRYLSRFPKLSPDPSSRAAR